MSNPATTRDALASDLVARFAAAGVDADVIAYARADPPEQRPRVILALRTVTNADVACPTRRCSVDVWAVVPTTTNDGTADDALDAFLGSVLDALDASPHTGWTTAQRGVFAESHPAYRIEAERNVA